MTATIWLTLGPSWFCARTHSRLDSNQRHLILLDVVTFCNSILPLPELSAGRLVSSKSFGQSGQSWPFFYRHDSSMTHRHDEIGMVRARRDCAELLSAVQSAGKDTALSLPLRPVHRKNMTIYGNDATCIELHIEMQPLQRNQFWLAMSPRSHQTSLASKDDKVLNIHSFFVWFSVCFRTLLHWKIISHFEFSWALCWVALLIKYEFLLLGVQCLM